MKKPLFRASRYSLLNLISSVLAPSLLLCAAMSLKADTIYNNSTNDLKIRFDPGTLEVGDQIVLEGTARYLTNFSFEYWGTSTTPGDFAGDVEACIRFYLNDGAEFNGYATPGTKFYDSGWFAVEPTDRTVVEFTAGSDFNSAGLYIPASEFTWSVQFRNLGAGDTAGVDLYGPLTAGLNYPDYWERTLTGWQLMTNENTDINFAAVLQASQTAVVPPGGGTIYNNSTNDMRVRFDPGTLEVGDQILLAGHARYLTNFSFEYWGTSSTPGAFAGNVEACVRFYLNNGPNYNGYATPGTQFYDSGWFSVQPTDRSVLVFTAGGDLPHDGLLIPTSEFTWSVQFRGLGTGDAAGVDLYGPITSGMSYPDYWVRDAALGWQLETNSSMDINFAAVLQASELPLAPALQISLLQGKAVLSWPSWASNYELLTSPQVSGDIWSVVTSDIYISGENYVRTNTVAPGDVAFFRLHRIQ